MGNVLLAGNGNIALSAGAAPPEKTGGHALPRVLDYRLVEQLYIFICIITV